MIGLKRPQRKERRPPQPVDEEAFVGMASENLPEEPVTNTLMAIERARHALEAAVGLGEVKELRNQAEAMRVYAKQAQCSLEIQNMCAELKLRSERKAGGMLRDITVKGGERHKSHDGTYERLSVLEELGISKMQSSRWQTIAALPEEIFERHLDKVKGSQTELTTASLIRLSTILKHKEADRPAREESPVPEEPRITAHHAQRPPLPFLDFWDALAILRIAIENARHDNWKTVSREAVVNQLQGLIELVQEIELDPEGTF